MDPDLATLTAWSYGLAGFCYAAFAVQLGLGWRGARRHWALLVAVALTAVWGLTGLAFAWFGLPSLLVSNAVADVLRTGGWYAFLIPLIERPLSDVQGDRVRMTWLAPVAGFLVLIGLVAQILLASKVEQRVVDPHHLMVFGSVAAAVFGLMLVEQLFRSVPEDARWQVKPLCVGLAGAFIFDIYLYADALLFNSVDGDVWSVRGFVYALALPLVATTIARNRTGSFQFALSRRMVFRSTALMATGAYLLIIAAAGYYVREFGGSWGRALQVAFVFTGLLLLGMLAFSGSIRAKLRVLVSKHFFSYRYDYREEWLRFTQKLSVHGGQNELGQHAIKALADMVESPGGGLWMRDQVAGVYAQQARWNMPANSTSEEIGGTLERFLLDSGWVINLEEYRSTPKRYGDLRLPAWLGEVPDAWLIVPLVTGAELIGFVILATARARVDVNWEVNDLLKAAGRQAASFLGQMQAAEALLEARKFDAFHRMSAFVVHDLKNIVTQLSLMLRNAERHRANPEFQKDMLMTVDNAVERMKQLMMQLREASTPVNAPHRVELGPIIERILRAKADQEPVPEFQVEATVAARGHADRLERVIGHLLQNALDATDKSGRVWLKLGRLDGQALVEIGDTGHGMTAEFVQERLFKPFQTTKQTGMGIGAYESFQYVQELGGQLLVDTVPNVGTRMQLLLPLFESEPAPPGPTRENVVAPSLAESSGEEAA